MYSPIEVSSCVKSSLMKEATYYLVFQENIKRIWNVCGPKVKHIIKCILSVGLCQHSQSVWAPGVTYLCEEPRASFPKCLFDKISFILPPTSLSSPPQVREMAASTVSGLVRCGYISCVDRLKVSEKLWER